MNEEVLVNTTFASNILAVQPGRCGFSIIDEGMLEQYDRDGLDDISLVFNIKTTEKYRHELQGAPRQGRSVCVCGRLHH